MNERQQKYYRELVDLVTTKFCGTVLSETYKASGTKMTFMCKKSHKFDMTPNSVKRGHWCNRCSRGLDEAEDEFYQKVKEKGGLCLTKYITAHKHVEVQCQYGHIFKVTPHALKGLDSWCSQCYGNHQGDAKEKFKKLVMLKGWKLLGTYINCKERVHLQCQYGHTWWAIPNNINTGKGCNVCGYIDDDAIQKFYDKVKEKGGQVIGNYVNSKTKISLVCSEGHQWEAKPNCIMNGTWCKICAGLDSEIAEDKLYKLVESKGGFILEDYINTKTYITLMCSRGHLWRAEPRSIKSGTWCDICSRFNHDAKQKLDDIVKEHNGIYQGDYANCRDDLTFKCSQGHTWITKPKYVLAGAWCPQCRKWVSKGEELAAKTLTSLEIPYVQQYVHSNLPSRKYDFFFTYNNVKYILEIDGIQHFTYVEYFHRNMENFAYKQNVDRIKTYVPLITGYKMIRIDYSQIGKLSEHLCNAFISSENIYVSNIQLYHWLLGSDVPIDLLNEECPHLLS